MTLSFLAFFLTAITNIHHWSYTISVCTVSACTVSCAHRAVFSPPVVSFPLCLHVCLRRNKKNIWDVPFKSVRLKKVIGEGSFGYPCSNCLPSFLLQPTISPRRLCHVMAYLRVCSDIWEGHWRGMTVAVKVMSTDAPPPVSNTADDDDPSTDAFSIFLREVTICR